MTEQVNGRRCVIVGEEDGTLRAYNRAGGEVAVPAAALALARLGGSFIIDGAALEGDQAGGYRAFDYLARYGAWLRARPYEERIARLAAAFADAALIAQAGATPARTIPTVTGLGLLIPASTVADKAAVLAEISASGGVGIILRDLDGPSIAGDTPYDLTWPIHRRPGAVRGNIRGKAAAWACAGNAMARGSRSIIGTPGGLVRRLARSRRRWSGCRACSGLGRQQGAHRRAAGQSAHHVVHHSEASAPCGVKKARTWKIVKIFQVLVLGFAQRRVPAQGR